MASSMASECDTVALFAIIVLVIFPFIPYFRHTLWISEKFSDYVFEPDLPSVKGLYLIPVMVLLPMPAICKLAPDLWARIGVWWLELGVVLEFCWLWVIIAPRACRKCGGLTDAYRANRYIKDESSDEVSELSYYYVCHFCRRIFRRPVSGIGRD